MAVRLIQGFESLEQCENRNTRDGAQPSDGIDPRLGERGTYQYTRPYRDHYPVRRQQTFANRDITKKKKIGGRGSTCPGIGISSTHWLLRQYIDVPCCTSRYMVIDPHMSPGQRSLAPPQVVIR